MNFNVKKTGGRMWHEARKQERKIRGMLVDYRRRAERRKDYYDKIKSDPTQFLQIHGRSCRIHLDSAIAMAGDSPATMMPWQGHEDNLIDRFDVRAHLDYIPEFKDTIEVDIPLTSEDRYINYERYRIIVQNEFLGVTEEKFLHQIFIEEQFGSTAKIDAKDKKKSANNVAIGYNYETDEAITKFPEVSEAKPTEEKQDEESDVDLDICVNISEIGSSQAHEMNIVGQKYGLLGADYFSFLTQDFEEAESVRQTRKQEEEKAMYSGRKSRRERRAFREKKMLGRVVSPPSYAARQSPEYNPYRSSSKSRSRSGSPNNSGQITFITSFGGEEEAKKMRKTTGVNATKINFPPSKRKKSVSPVFNDKLVSKNASRSSPTCSKRSTSSKTRSRRSRSNVRSRNRSRSRQNSQSRRYNHFKRSRFSSRSQSRDSRRSRSYDDSRCRRQTSPSRCSRSLKTYRSRSHSSNSSSSHSKYHTSPHRRSRSRRRYSSIAKNRSSSRSQSQSASSGRSTSGCRNRRRRTSKSRYQKSRLKSFSKTRYNRSESKSSYRSISPLRAESRSRSRSRSKIYPSRQSKSRISTSTRSRTRSRSKTRSNIDLDKSMVPRYYGRRGKSSSSEITSSDSERNILQSESKTRVDANLKKPNAGLSNSNSDVATKSGSVTLQERLKKKMQALLNKQYKADKRAEKIRIERMEQQRQDREDEIREISLKLRKKQREKRHRYDERHDDDSRSSKSRSRSRGERHEKNYRRDRSSSPRKSSTPRDKRSNSRVRSDEKSKDRCKSSR